MQQNIAPYCAYRDLKTLVTAIKTGGKDGGSSGVTVVVVDCGGGELAWPGLFRAWATAVEKKKGWQGGNRCSF